jgi:hypoxanthine phosphoribosyltransferase
MKIELKDKHFEVFITKQQIKQRTAQIGELITSEFEGKDLVIVGVLNGSFIFMADLCRNIELPLSTVFLRISSYVGTATSRKVRSILGIEENLEGKSILIVEDIVDTGISMNYLLNQLKSHKPAEVRIATLLHKPQAFQFNYHLDYVGFEIPNKFVVGYGLDYDGFGRNLPDIYQLSTS